MVVQLRGIVEKKGSKKVVPLFLKPSSNCPFKYLRKPNSREVANCRVVENPCDWFWPNKVCLEITTSIEATLESPVELLCNYEDLTKAYPPDRHQRHGRKRKRKVNAADDVDDFSGEDSDADVDDPVIVNEEDQVEQPD